MVEKFIHCWNISEKFYEQLKKNDLSYLGTKPYDFDHSNSFNAFLAEELSKFYDKEKQKPLNQLKTVKSQIISVLHPLTFEFISYLFNNFFITFYLYFHIR